MSDLDVCPRHLVKVPRTNKTTTIVCDVRSTTEPTKPGVRVVEPARANKTTSEPSRINTRNYERLYWIIYKIIGTIFAIAVLFGILFWFDSGVIRPGHFRCTSHSQTNDSRLEFVPPIVWYTTDIVYLPLSRTIECSSGSRVLKCALYSQQSQPEDAKAYLFDASQMDSIPLPRDSRIIWGLIHNSSPSTKVMFMHEKGLNLFNFSATFSRFSDIPMPLIWFKSLDDIVSPLYFIDTRKKNALLNGIAPVIYLQSNCHTFTERDVYVKKMMEYIEIDSYGVCLHNKELYLNRVYRNSYKYNVNDQELMKFIANYKFMITIENTVCNDYISEKFWRAIRVGTVPIYYGSPLIRDWLPNNKSAILLEDFPTPELLSRHLHYLLRNDTAYEEYLEHKTLGIISNQKLIDEIVTRPYQTDIDKVKKNLECLVCKRLHDNGNRIDIVTKKHLDCPVPPSALTLSVNPSNPKLELISQAEMDLEKIYKQILTPIAASGSYNMSWW